MQCPHRISDRNDDLTKTGTIGYVCDCDGSLKSSENVFRIAIRRYSRRRINESRAGIGHRNVVRIRTVIVNSSDDTVWARRAKRQRPYEKNSSLTSIVNIRPGGLLQVPRRINGLDRFESFLLRQVPSIAAILRMPTARMKRAIRVSIRVNPVSRARFVSFLMSSLANIIVGTIRLDWHHSSS